MTASERRQIQTLGISRGAIGAAMVLAPGPCLRGWIGPHPSSPGVRLITRALGMREIALGVGTVLALRHDAPVRGWLEAGTLVDASDALTTVLAFRHLPIRARLGVPLSAAVAVAMGRRLASKAS